MTLSRTEVIPGLSEELSSFGELIGSLDASEWATPTRCAGWSVADVSAHVIGSIADIAAGRLDGLGSPEVTAREVDERRGRTPAELVAELSEVSAVVAALGALFDDEAWEGPGPGGYGGSLGEGVQALWYDTYLHADDVRAALGRPSVRGAGLRAGVHHVAHVLETRGFGPASLAFEQMEVVPVGTGAGATYSGDALEFVLASTGRIDPAPLGLEASVNIYAS